MSGSPSDRRVFIGAMAVGLLVFIVSMAGEAPAWAALIAFLVTFLQTICFGYLLQELRER